MADAESTSEKKCKDTEEEKKDEALRVADRELQAMVADSTNTKASNSFSNHLQTACLDSRHRPQSDADSFEKLFKAWKNQDISTEVLEKNTKSDNEFLQKKLIMMEQRLNEVNKSNVALDLVVDGLHADLDWVDKVEQDNKTLKDKVKQLQEKLTEKENELKSKSIDYEERLSQEMLKSETMIGNITVKMTKQLEENEAEKRTQEELHRQEVETFKEKLDRAEKVKANELASLTVEYEDKFAKLQRLKSASAHNQPQTSSHQEIFRKKLHQLRSEYESETKSLREQIKTLQCQLAGQSLRNTQVGRQTASPVPTFAKRPRKF